MLPAAESLLLRPGQRLVLGDARGLFLVLIVLLAAVNYLPTRYAMAALVLASGQVMALAPYSPLRGFSLGASGSAVGLVLAGAALGAAWGLAVRGRDAGPLDRVWLDFRDAYGLLWGLRVMERINATANQLGWDVELRWSGFRHRHHAGELRELPEAQRQALQQALESLLRRFVSRAWITERLAEASLGARRAKRYSGTDPEGGAGG